MLVELPASIGGLINLEELYLSNNQLTDVPESLSYLSSLKLLRLNDNQIQYLL